MAGGDRDVGVAGVAPGHGLRPGTRHDASEGRPPRHHRFRDSQHAPALQDSARRSTGGQSANQQRQAHLGPRRGAGRRAGCLRSQSLQLFARSAALDPRLREPRRVRRARGQGPGGRHPADPARRPGPAHQPRPGRGGPHRSPPRLVLGALRQRLRRRREHLDRSHDPRPLGRSAARRRRAFRRQYRPHVVQVADGDTVPGGPGQRLRERVAPGVRRRARPQRRGPAQLEHAVSGARGRLDARDPGGRGG